MPTKKILLIILVFLFIIAAVYYFFNFKKSSVKGISTTRKSSYTFVFVGDSMTEYLGSFDELKADLKKYLPGKNFLLLNYGFSSTNILSVPDRLIKLSDHNGRGYQPINDIAFDLIFIESFGYNPLSESSLEEGLKKQSETLEQIVNIIAQKHPKSTIVFIATIAPNKDYFGGGALNLLPEQKEKWVNERISYIKNHIDFARSHNIPLINIYEKSLDEKGMGKIDYINSTDYLHPSPTGIYFISGQIAKFIQGNP